MDAIRFSLDSKKLEFCKIPIPKVKKPDEVLVKVAYSGVCGTDLHIIQGEFPVDPTKPLILGHEFSGTVVDVGCVVKNVRKGDRVAIDPNDGCNCCTFCRSGNYHNCMDKENGWKGKIGTFKDGGWAEYALADEKQVFKIPDVVTLKQAALIEPMSCLTHGWDIISPITVGQKVLILGAGIIGNLWVCALHFQGHRNVTLSEPNVARLNLLKKIDTGYQLVTPDDLQRNVETFKNHFDVIVDCSGNAKAIESSIQFLQKGGKLCCFGVAPTKAEIKIKPFDIYMKEMKIYGVCVNPYSFPKATGLIEAMGERYLDYNKLGIQVFPLKQYEKAIEILKKGTIAKAVFEF